MWKTSGFYCYVVLSRKHWSSWIQTGKISYKRNKWVSINNKSKFLTYIYKEIKILANNLHFYYLLTFLTLSVPKYLATLLVPGGGSYMTPPLIPPLYDLELWNKKHLVRNYKNSLNLFFGDVSPSKMGKTAKNRF